MGGDMKRIVFRVVVAIGLVLFLAGNLQAQVKLTVGKAVAKTFEFIPVDIGLELGFFKKRGLDLKVVAFRGGAKLQQAFAAGSVDIALDAGVGVVAAIGKGSPGELIGLIGDKPHLMVLIVGRESGVRRRADLKGKTIGVTSHGALTDWLVKRFEEVRGWPRGSVTRVPLGGFTGQMAALTRRQIDGFVWSADGGWDIEERGLGKVLFSFGEVLPGIAFETIQASNKLIRDDPAAVKAFLQGWYEAVRYMKANKDYTIGKIAKLLGVSRRVAGRTYELDIGNLSRDGTVPKGSLEFIIKSHVADGLFSAPLEVRKIYSGQFVPVR